VILNKIALSGPLVNLQTPLFVTWIQLVITLICMMVLGLIGEKYTLIPPFEFQRERVRKTIALSLIFLGMTVFNNLCLYYVEVSFYQVARGTTILFSVLFMYALLQTTISWDTIKPCLVVFVGFFVGCFGEVYFSWGGTIFGVISSAFAALYIIYVKKTLPVVENNHWKLMMYNTVMSILLLIPLIIANGEHAIILDTPVLYEIGYWKIQLITGIFVFLVNIAIFLQIKYTSPLAHNVSGTIKNFFQTMIAIAYFQNEITIWGGIGSFLVIIGSFWYSYVKYKEMQQEVKEREENV